MSTHLEFLDDPRAFLRAAASLLEAAPVETTVVATVADRLSRDPDAWGVSTRESPTWWLVVRDDAGTVVGAGMSTAPFPPYPVYLLSMPDAAARALAAALQARGETVGGVNGALPAVEIVATELERSSGRRHRVAERTRLFELEALVEPAAPLGVARLARAEEVEQVLAWYQAFGRDAAEQAGRTTPHPGPEEDLASMARRIEE